MLSTKHAFFNIFFIPIALSTHKALSFQNLDNIHMGTSRDSKRNKSGDIPAPSLLTTFKLKFPVIRLGNKNTPQQQTAKKLRSIMKVLGLGLPHRAAILVELYRNIEEGVSCESKLFKNRKAVIDKLEEEGLIDRADTFIRLSASVREVLNNDSDLEKVFKDCLGLLESIEKYDCRHSDQIPTSTIRQAHFMVDEIFAEFQKAVDEKHRPFIINQYIFPPMISKPTGQQTFTSLGQIFRTYLLAEFSTQDSTSNLTAFEDMMREWGLISTMRFGDRCFASPCFSEEASNIMRGGAILFGKSFGLAFEKSIVEEPDSTNNRSIRCLRKTYYKWNKDGSQTWKTDIVFINTEKFERDVKRRAKQIAKYVKNKLSELSNKRE